MEPRDRSRAIRDAADAVHWLSAAIDTLTDGDMDDVVLGELRYAADALERARERIASDMAARAARVASGPLPPDLAADLIKDASK